LTIVHLAGDRIQNGGFGSEERDGCRAGLVSIARGKGVMMIDPLSVCLLLSIAS
jgi:hypothetical protein